MDIEVSSPIDKDSTGLSQSTITKIIKNQLQEKTVVSSEFAHYVKIFAEEFISVTSSEAARINDNENKRLLGPDAIIKALKSLGFKSIASKVEQDLDREIQSTTTKPRKRKMKELDPETKRLQQEDLKRTNEHFQSLQKELEEL